MSDMHRHDNAKIMFEKYPKSDYKMKWADISWQMLNITGFLDVANQSLFEYGFALRPIYDKDRNIISVTPVKIYFESKTPPTYSFVDVYPLDYQSDIEESKVDANTSKQEKDKQLKTRKKRNP